MAVDGRVTRSSKRQHPTSREAPNTKNQSAQTAIGTSAASCNPDKRLGKKLFREGNEGGRKGGRQGPGKYFTESHEGNKGARNGDWRRDLGGWRSTRFHAGCAGVFGQDWLQMLLRRARDVPRSGRGFGLLRGRSKLGRFDWCRGKPPRHSPVSAGPHR